MYKYLTVIALLSIFVAACSNREKLDAPVDGVYNMLSQTFKSDMLDSTFTQLKQLKIYHDGYVIYARVNTADSLGAFGMGTFTMDSGRLTENIVFSATDTLADINTYSITENITLNDKGFTMFIPGVNAGQGKMSVTEKYESAGTGEKSALDGIWKQSSGYSYKGKDTVFWNDVQYKAFYGGRFLYGNYVGINGADKGTYTSFGTFALNGANLQQNITSSSTPALNGKTVSIKVAFTGNDTYAETHDAANGRTEVIVYQRVKK